MNSVRQIRELITWCGRQTLKKQQQQLNINEVLGYPKAKSINFTSGIRLIEEVTFKTGLIKKT